MSEQPRNWEIWKPRLLASLLEGFEESEDINGREDDPRSLFEREYDRVIFSDYFRVLASKTQVVPLSECDSTHSRLTHSLEVASVGRSLGRLLVKKLDLKEKNELKLKHLPDIIATACLLHDIGNPPFGHAGEDAIKGFFIEFFDEQDNGQGSKEHVYNRCQKLPEKLCLEPEEYKDFTFFDGNANGFRIITRLAGKANDGYKLSPVTLAAYTKYPFPSGGFPDDDKKAKFGYFRAEEKEGSCNKLPKLFSEKKRHPLAYLVEAADDICNRVIDLEDAIKNGHISFNDIQFTTLWKEFKQQTDFDSDTAVKSKIDKAESDLKNYNPNRPILATELKALETLRAEAIRFFIKKVFENYSDSSIGNVAEGKFILIWKELVKHTKMDQLEKKIVENYLERILYCHSRKADIEIAGYKVIRFILKLMLNALCELKNKSAFEDCDTKTKHLIRYLGIGEDNFSEIKNKNHSNFKTDYDLCLLVTDFITKCSDRELLSHYHNWMGIDS